MEAQTVDFVIVNDTISEIVYVFMYGVLYISCIIMFTRFAEPSWDCVQADAGTPVEGANYPQITGYRSGIVGDNPNIQMLGTSRAVSVLKTQIIICQCCKLDSEQSVIKKELLLFIGHDFPQHSLPTNLHYDPALFAHLLCCGCLKTSTLLIFSLYVLCTSWTFSTYLLSMVLVMMICHTLFSAFL